MNWQWRKTKLGCRIREEDPEPSTIYQIESLNLRRLRGVDSDLCSRDMYNNNNNIIMKGVSSAWMEEYLAGTTAQ